MISPRRTCRNCRHLVERTNRIRVRWELTHLVKLRALYHRVHDGGILNQVPVNGGGRVVRILELVSSDMANNTVCHCCTKVGRLLIHCELD